MPTYCMQIEYEGTDWYGWQVQPDQPTVQGAIETALSTALRHEVGIVGAGRTDTGVHALGQVAHFFSERPVDTYRLTAQVNGILPGSIAVPVIREVDDGFHARYSAVWRLYHYGLSTRFHAVGRRYRWHVKPAPDLEAMNRAAAHLVGQIDFTSFCKAAAETDNRLCTVSEAHWREDDRTGDATFIIRADRFLRGMVRTVVGTLVQIGHGLRPEDDIGRILAAGDRRAAGYSAPARGLTLVAVGYDTGDAEGNDPGP
ncbi:MAG: tRNA pseudouridine(38-40) synthase TruA [Rhodothermales bacterium]|nr:tRNA pseudouridine(38-40) synthase TruA [Rhodothermales bacterium]